MTLTPEQVRAYRLKNHHLDVPLSSSCLEDGAGACGVQNSPPGAWETAMWNRVEGIDLCGLRAALEERKTLLQAWSIRGAPLVFPTRDAGVFLTPLCARLGEEPWIYTRGVTAALEALGMTFSQLLPLVEGSCACLEGESVHSKEALDRRLAALVEPELPAGARNAWRAPSMYGHPDRQTVGEAAVSFLLRPCAFRGRVVFGARTGGSPTFTAPVRWLGGPLPGDQDGERELVRRFLRCFGPAQVSDLKNWLGCSSKQAGRLWEQLREELEAVEIGRRRRWVLAADLSQLSRGEEGERLLLLGPHDPYLDVKDRESVLPDKLLQRQVWKTVGNPGAVLLGGRVAGIWTVRTKGERLDVTVTLFEPLSPARQRKLEELAEGYALFREKRLDRWTLCT